MLRRSVNEEEGNNEIKEPKEEHQEPPPQYVKVQHSPRQRNQPKQYQQTSPNQYNEQLQSQQVKHSPRQRMEQQEQQQQYQCRYHYSQMKLSEWGDPERMSHRRPHEGPYCDPVSSALTENTDHNSGQPNIRTANLLTATLCLLKELDCASLLVVEAEVRHRIDQLCGE